MEKEKTTPPYKVKTENIKKMLIYLKKEKNEK